MNDPMNVYFPSPDERRSWEVILYTAKGTNFCISKIARPTLKIEKENPVASLRSMLDTALILWETPSKQVSLPEDQV